MEKFKSNRSSVNKFACLLLFGTFLLSSSTAFATQTGEWRWDKVESVVVVPDVHGAFPAFTRLLQETQLVDSSLNWIGGDTHLVSLGDLLDRGPESRQTMGLLMRLQQEAQAAGGYVHVVAGNHELMNLTGDLRYVSKAEFQAFAFDETTQMRDQAFQDFLVNTQGTFESEDAAKLIFKKKFPAGYFAHRKAFSVDGIYGSWLLSLPAIVVINDIAYVHAGLPNIVANLGLGKINRDYQSVTKRYMQLWRELTDQNILPNDESQDAGTLARSVLQNALPSNCIDSRKKNCQQLQQNSGPPLNEKSREKLKEFIAVSDNPIIGIDGPLWSRRAVYCREIFETTVLHASMQKLGVTQVVVGHTTTPDAQVHTLHNKALTLLDTGMLVSYYKGRPAALVIEDGQQMVQYLDPNERLAPVHGLLPGSYNLSDETIKNILANGIITVVDKPSGAQLSVGGAWKVQVQHNNKKLQAIFYPYDRQGQGQNELAAAALDDLVGFDLVPQTVERNVGNTNGALQLGFNDSINEKDRLKNNVDLGGWCPISRQYQLMYAWDILTANSGRSNENIHYRQTLGLLYLTEHTNAFGTNKRLPKKIRKDVVKLSPETRRHLTDLTMENLQQAFGNTIDKQKIQALLSRRDAMLKTLR